MRTTRTIHQPQPDYYRSPSVLLAHRLTVAWRVPRDEVEDVIQEVVTAELEAGGRLGPLATTQAVLSYLCTAAHTGWGGAEGVKRRIRAATRMRRELAALGVVLLDDELAEMLNLGHSEDPTRWHGGATSTDEAAGAFSAIGPAGAPGDDTWAAAVGTDPSSDPMAMIALSAAVDAAVAAAPRNRLLTRYWHGLVDLVAAGASAADLGPCVVGGHLGMPQSTSIEIGRRLAGIVSAIIEDEMAAAA